MKTIAEQGSKTQYCVIHTLRLQETEVLKDMAQAQELTTTQEQFQDRLEELGKYWASYKRSEVFASE